MDWAVRGSNAAGGEISAHVHAGLGTLSASFAVHKVSLSQEQSGRGVALTTHPI